MNGNELLTPPKIPGCGPDRWAVRAASVTRSWRRPPPERRRRTRPAL